MSEPNLEDYPTISAFIGDRVDFRPGAMLHRAADDLIRIARACDKQMHGTFNGVEMRANPGDAPSAVLAEFDLMMNRRHLSVDADSPRTPSALELLQGRVDTVLALHQPSTAHVVIDWPRGNVHARTRQACTGCSYAYADCPTRAILVVPT